MICKIILPIALLVSASAQGNDAYSRAGSFRPIAPIEAPGHAVFPQARGQYSTRAPSQKEAWDAAQFYSQQPKFTPQQQPISNRPYAQNNVPQQPAFVEKTFATRDRRFRPPDLKGTP